MVRAHLKALKSQPKKNLETSKVKKRTMVRAQRMPLKTSQRNPVTSRVKTTTRKAPPTKKESQRNPVTSKVKKTTTRKAPQEKSQPKRNQVISRVRNPSLTSRV